MNINMETICEDTVIFHTDVSLITSNNYQFIKKIENVDGVEYANVYGKYMVSVRFGKLFIPKEKREEIEEIIKEFFNADSAITLMLMEIEERIK